MISLPMHFNIFIFPGGFRLSIKFIQLFHSLGAFAGERSGQPTGQAFQRDFYGVERIEVFGGDAPGDKATVLFR